MRTALLFFGRMKHFELTYASLVKSLGNVIIDVFYSSDNEPEESIQRFIQLCKPISIINDKIVYDVDFTKYPLLNPDIHHPNYDNMTRHFINKKRVFTLLEYHMQTTGATYDMVVSARLDVPINTLPYIEPSENTVYIPAGNDYCGINDRFALGNVESMKKYMMLYDTAIPILESKLSSPHPESLALANIIYTNLQVERFPLSTEIMR
jgi:hypothetical protein